MRQLDISGKIAPPIVGDNGCERCGVVGGVVGVACVNCLNAECNREISALPLSATTIRQYAWTWRNFARWCAENRHFARPLDESIIQKWLTVRIADGATSRTIAQDYAVLRALGQHWRETIEPGPVLVATLRKLRKNARDTPYRHARPLRPADLHAIVGRPQVSGGLRIVAERDTTAILLGWAIGARPQDLAALRWRDVDYIGGMLVVRVPPGKSGARVAHVLPARDAAICPVSILRRWAQILGETFDEPSDRPLFPRIDRWGNYRRSVGISAKAVADIVALACKSAGLGDGFGGGSLRSGFVTSAAEAGVADVDIARQTGHRTMSALARYRRELTVTTNPALRLI